MRQSLPPLNWLRAFDAAARHLSFTGAAGELNMTQSAISQQIKALETHLGQALFYRRPRGLDLTQTGATYLPVVRDAFRTLSHGTRAVTISQRDVVQVQSNISFAVHWLAPRLPRFRALHPTVLLNITTELWEPLGMTEGADIEIRFSLRPADGLNFECLHRGDYYPVCAPDYPARLDRLSQAPLYDCANLLCNWPSWAEDHAVAWPNPPVTIATTYTVTLSAVIAGGGFSLAHDAIAQSLIDQGRLIAPFSLRSPMQEAYYLIQSPQADNLPGAQAFTNWLRTEMQTDWQSRSANR